MENWKGTQFTDVGGGLFELTHRTGNSYTVKILTPPKDGKPSIANPKFKLSENEFVIHEKTLTEHFNSGNIKIK
jgi:hypothetical protein